MDANLDEYKGKDADQKKAIQQYRDSLEQSRDFVRPYFQKFTRFYSLFSGNRPPEADTTFSQIMLWYPYAIIDKELPLTLKSYFSTPNWISVEAMEMEKERDATIATQWLKYQLEKKQKFSTSIMPTMQGTHVFGTGYRWYYPTLKRRTSSKPMVKRGIMGVPEGMGYESEEKEKWIVTGKDVNIFNVFPSPFGGSVNGTDENSEDAVDYLIVQTWMTDEMIKGQVEAGNFDKRQAELLFKTVSEVASDPSASFKEEMLGTKSGWSTFSAPSFVPKMQELKLGVSRYRVAWYMRRDKWFAIAEDKYLLYSGKPLYDCFPLAKFTGSYNMSNWFGIGLIEPSEDLIISIILNFNHRMDYLAGSFHPAKFLPQRLIDDVGGDLSMFDPEPYKVIPYNHKQFVGGVGNYIHVDRNDSINQQAFIEEDKMQGYMEEIIGQYSIQNLSGEGASTGQALITKDIARQMMRAINIENSGILESANLTMKLNKKYMLEPEWIRDANADGFPWRQIDPETLDGEFGFNIVGSRELEMGESNFRKMIATAQYLLQNPAIRGQVEIARQLAEKGGYRNVDTIINGEQSPDMSSMAGLLAGEGGQVNNNISTASVPFAGSPSGSNVRNDVAQTMGAQMAGQGVLV